jgi:hypothetical protein
MAYKGLKTRNILIFVRFKIGAMKKLDRQFRAEWFRSFTVGLRTGFALQVFSTARQKIGTELGKRKFDLVT